MKIFFFSTVFHPSVGGIERVAETLCTQFVRLGHEVRLATLTPGPSGGDFPFEVVRQPRPRAFLRMLRWSDIHIQANVSLKYCFALPLKYGQFIYRHGNVYQRDDGSLSALDRLKRAVARWSPGIANSRYTAMKLGCRYVVLNPYDDQVFRRTTEWSARPGDLVFLGRLVSQKGCDVLVRALGILAGQGTRPKLTIIGQGPDRRSLEELAGQTGVAQQIRFAGVLQGHALAEELNRHRFLVVPSRYEEPFGIVALEGLACGCLPIVSERGGLVDAIGSHGVAVPNGDHDALARCLGELLAAPDRASALLSGVATHLEQFKPERVAARYLAIFEAALSRR